MHNYYVLSNEVGTVLAVYGSALSRMARGDGRNLKQQIGARVALHHIVGYRPEVGSSISMSGHVDWL